MASSYDLNHSLANHRLDVHFGAISSRKKVADKEVVAADDSHIERYKRLLMNALLLSTSWSPPGWSSCTFTDTYSRSFSSSSSNSTLPN